jgi:predicted DCC family thiol-disulfide oxidoreductase YuxK
MEFQNNYRSSDRTILFYDGECAFCHWSIKLVADWLKPMNSVKFAPLQGSTATRLRAEGLAIPADLDAVCFVDGIQVALGPFAFYEAAKYFRMPWALIACGRILPAFFSWGIYRLIARNRYRLFGKADAACILPTAEQRAAQLD